MKTPLPSKIEIKNIGNMDVIQLVSTINQYHDYLAELTELAEGKQDNFYSKSAANYELEYVAKCLKKQALEQSEIYEVEIPTPSLKVRLLTELIEAGKGEPSDEYERGYDHGLYTAEVIIRRLMP